MLFNSFDFLCLFLPVVLTGFFLLSSLRWLRSAIGWLALASLGFYAYWNPHDLPLLLGSIGFNYGCSRVLERARRWRGPVLALAILVNLGLLGYFKYSGFALATFARLTGHAWTFVATAALPLGISFFTFTQIAYLVDLYRERSAAHRFLDYLLFVTVFPHLIAGPIIHHQQVIPQLSQERFFTFSHENFAQGLMFFIIGLSKKVLIADYLGPVVNAAYKHLSLLTCGDAWLTASGYALQLYFDFSGYSDMAVGLGLMFNLALPFNFNSPYRSASIAEFWRRWHMTLSAFLRQYVYIPLGGNRKGELRGHLNLMATMLIGGLWHGAGWTFVLWGGLNGLYLVINRLWSKTSLALPRPLAVALTLLATLVAWVFFRAPSVGEAGAMLRRMADLRSLASGWSQWADHPYLACAMPLLWLAVLTCRNSQQLVASIRPTWTWGLAFAGLALVALCNIGNVSQFLYFQF